jgi:hypothetical protein
MQRTVSAHNLLEGLRTAHTRVAVAHSHAQACLVCTTHRLGDMPFIAIARSVLTGVSEDSPCQLLSLEMIVIFSRMPDPCAGLPSSHAHGVYFVHGNFDRLGRRNDLGD